jgi:hypothetical protein
MYDRSRMAQGAGASLALWALIGLLVTSTGVAYALPLGGVGGFVVNGSQVTAEDITLYPGVDDTSERSAYPQAVVELQSVQIQDLTLRKTIPVDAIPGLSGTATLSIVSSGTTEADRILLKSSALTSDRAIFQQLQIDEQPVDDPSSQFTLRADGDPGLELQNANIRAHYLTTSSITLPQLSLTVDYDGG